MKESVSKPYFAFFDMINFWILVIIIVINSLLSIDYILMYHLNTSSVAEMLSNCICVCDIALLCVRIVAKLEACKYEYFLTQTNQMSS